MIAAVLVWGIYSIIARQRALLILPDPDLSSAEPSVAAKIREIQDHVRKSPLAADRWGRLGMNYDAHGLRVEALTSYQQATQFDPRSFHWTYFTAIARQQQRSEEAVTWYQRAHELRPDHAPLLVRFGQSLMDANRLQHARQVFQEAIVLDSNFSSYPYFGLAQIAVSESDLPTARTVLLLGLERNPSHRDIYVLLSEVHRRENNSDLAANAASMAEQLPFIAPLDDSVYARVAREGTGSFWAATRGRAFLRLGDYDAAIRELSTALEERATATARADLGDALYQKGRHDDAVEQYRLALTLDPNQVVALTNLGATYLELNRSKEGYEQLARAKALAPDSARPYLRLATLHAARQRWVEAIDELRAGRARSPEDYQLMSRLALLLATVQVENLRDGTEAVRLAQCASALRSDRDAEALAVLAAAYAEAGDADATLATAREAHRLAVVSRRPALARQIEANTRRFQAAFATSRN